MLPINQILKCGCLYSSGTDDVWVGWSTQEMKKLANPERGGLQVYAPDFFLEDPHPWWSFPESEKISRGKLIELLQGWLQRQGDPGWSRTWNWKPADHSHFRDTLIHLKELFRSGFLKKAVPVVFEEVQIPFQSRILAHLLISLLQNTRGFPLTLYGVWDRSEGVLGATPELLFSYRGKTQPIQTAALAGTRIQGSSLPPLLSDPKELEEHQIVIDGIRSTLGPLGTVVVGKTQEVVLPHLSHLYTPLQLQLLESEQHLTDAEIIQKVVKCLHPTPALGAYPREQGMAWLRSYQKKIPRKRFGAPWGVLWGSEEGQFVVGIRNVQWEGDRIELGAGCGVIAASEVDREWNEIQGKMQSVKRIFQL